MPQKFLSIKNFEKYQTYKLTNPPWFKIHKSFFGDREVTKLSPVSRYLYLGLIYLATETNNSIANDRTWIAQRLAITEPEVDLRPLYKAGFLKCTHVHRYLSEKDSSETGQDRTDIKAVRIDHEFDQFWDVYPKKVDKERAKKAWQKLMGSRPDLSVLLTALAQQQKSRQWQEGFIPNPATWLTGKRWNDELPQTPDSLKTMAHDFLSRGTVSS